MPGVGIARVQGHGGAQLAQADADDGAVADLGAPAGRNAGAGILHLIEQAEAKVDQEFQLALGRCSPLVLFLRGQLQPGLQTNAIVLTGVLPGFGVFLNLVDLELGFIQILGFFADAVKFGIGIHPGPYGADFGPMFRGLPGVGRIGSQPGQ